VRHAGPLGVGLLLALPLSGAAGLQAQASAAPLPAWRARIPEDGADLRRPVRQVVRFVATDSVRTRSHTWTGLLIGGLVGAAATTVFLIEFCGDPDTECGADEVGRAALVFALPAAAVGALVGSLIKTER